MGLLEAMASLVAPRVPRVGGRVAAWVWWGGDQVAVVRSAGRGVEPVLFDGWPLLPAPDGDDGTVWRRISQAVTVGGDDTVVAVPGLDWGPARRKAWHEAAEQAGVHHLEMLDPAAVIAAGLPEGMARDVPFLVAAGLSPGGRAQAAVLDPSADPVHPIVLAQVTGSDKDQGSAGVFSVITDAVTAAGVRPARQLLLITDPATAGRRVTQIEAVTGCVATTVTPVVMAETAVRVGPQRSPQIPRVPRAGVAATVATGLSSVTLAGGVITDTQAATIGEQQVPIFSPGHLALAGTGIAVTVVAASMLLVHQRLARAGAWDWRIAGRWLLGGCVAAAMAAGATGLVLASIHGTTAGTAVAWALLPAGPALLVTAVTGWRLSEHPDPPPGRRIWPPMAALTLGCLGMLVVRACEPLSLTGMPTAQALAARGGFAVVAVATAMAVTWVRPLVIGITAGLGLIYLATMSPSTGTTACLLLIGAVTIRAVAGLAGTVHHTPGDSRAHRPTRIAPAGGH